MNQLYIYIYPLFLDSFPITEYWVEFPVLYRRSLLVIYFIYSSVLMSIPIFQFIPPPRPPANHNKNHFLIALHYLNYLFIHYMLCARHSGEYIWRYPLLHFPTHVAHIQVTFLGVNSCIVYSRKKFHLWRYFFNILLSENGKYATVCFLFCCNCQKT